MVIVLPDLNLVSIDELHVTSTAIFDGKQWGKCTRVRAAHDSQPMIALHDSSTTAAIARGSIMWMVLE